MSIDFSSVMRGQLEQRRDRVARAISSGPERTACARFATTPWKPIV